MSVNFYKHRDRLVSEWKDLLDDKTLTSWILFGYENNSNDLQFIDKGSGNLDELVSELNPSRIFYAFCKLPDPNTGLPKVVLINWQGEGAPLSRKGICANHIHDVSKFFKGTHLTINARNEEDVEEDVILQRVARATSTMIDFKTRSEPLEHTPPIGSTYQRIQAAREINLKDRDHFWKAEQQSEQSRKDEELRIMKEKLASAERERKEKDKLEQDRRDKEAAEKEKEVFTQKRQEAERLRAEREAAANSSLSNGNDISENEKKQRSDLMSRERTEEAKSLIGGNKIKSARAIFEQNSYASQISSLNSSITHSTSKTTPKSESPVEGIARKGVAERWPPSSADTISSPPSNKLATQNGKPVSEVAPIISDTNGKHIPPIAHVAPLPSMNGPIRSNGHDDEEYSSIIEEEEEELEEEENSIQEEIAARYIPPPTLYYEPTPLEDIIEEEQESDDVIIPESSTPLNGDKCNSNSQNSTNNANNTHRENGCTELGLRARALYDYQAADDTEISFDPNDVITHIDQIDEGWWEGRAPNGKYGLFPANYVELVN